MFKREGSIFRGGSTGSASSDGSKVGDLAKDIPLGSKDGGGEVSLAAPIGGIPTGAWYSAISTSSRLWLLLGLSIATGIATGIIITSRSRRKQISKDFGAFVKYLELRPPPQPAPPIAPHPLTGLKFCIKDVFDVEGLVTGFGSPEWEKTHEAASCTAFSVTVLVQSGAICTAKTHMDEMALGITGQNKHYPLLINPVAPAHLPGGSSGGSAVAVAAGLVDFSLGTDTCGDVRIPAAYCGVLGFKPSHGALSYTGVLPVSQSLDTVGWFATHPDVLHKVGRVLLKPSLSTIKQPRRIFIADDCFSLLSVAEKRHLSVATSSIEKVFGKQAITRMKLGEYFASKIPSLKMSLVCFRVDGGRGKTERGFSALKSLSEACQLLKGHEFKLNHEEWVHNVMLTSSSGLTNHVKVALVAESELVSASLRLRNEARTAMSELLLNDGVLVIPTVSDPPLKLRSKASARIEVEEKTLILASIASMSGGCEASIPMGTHNGCPSAVSLVGKHGADHLLLHATDVLFPVVQMEAEEYESADHEDDDKEAPRPEDAEAAKEKGNEAFKRKDFKAAVLSYSEAIECDEENATYYSNRAAAYLAMQNFPLAEADCSRAIELDRKNVKAYMRRATARERRGCYKEADEDFRQALVLEPTNKTAADGIKRVRKLLYE